MRFSKFPNLVKPLFYALVLLALLVVIPACEEFPIEDIITPPIGTIDAVDQAVLQEMREQELAGVAVGVIQNGQITHLNGYGFADREAGTKVDRNTLFRWASISKTLTAFAALRMWEDGTLDLDKDVRDYVPSFPAKPEGTITTRHLLTNRSGVGHYADVSGWATNANNYPSNGDYNPTAALNVFSAAPLVFPPDSTYRYSTFGFMLAGAAIEGAAQTAYNKGYLDVVQEIADSLGMTSLQPDYIWAVPNNEAAGYFLNCSGQLTRLGDYDVSWRLPGGGFQSNIKDITRFAQALVNKELLDDTTYNMMFSPQSIDGDYGYGYGIQIFGRTSSTFRKEGHGGVQDKARTYMFSYPQQNATIVFLCNSNHLDRTRMLRRIANAIGINESIPSYSRYNDLDCDSLPSQSNGCKNASDQQFTGLWRQGNTDQIIRRGYTTDLFNAEWNLLGEAGYNLFDLETYLDANGTRLWDGVFTKDNREAALWRNFNTSDFNTKWNDMSSQGYQLIDLETYQGSGGQRLWAGVFIKNATQQALFRNFNTTDFNAKWSELAGQNYRLIDIETYKGTDGTRLWAGVWEAGTDNYALFRNYSLQDFATKRTEMANQGLRLVDIERYEGSNGQELWAGVWRAGTDNAKLNRNWFYCGFLGKDQDWRAQGFELVDFEAYER
jgi:CubicO group peptidase (beta-lactamase class C family)